MNAAILTIGQEILIGQIVDTNSAWIASQLNLIGINVSRIASIPDVESDIIHTLKQLTEKFDLVITTGGLGPTSDDITKLSFCKFFGCKLVTHHESLTQIEHLFKSRGLPLTDLNIQQALVPECCEPLLNRQGTAPGMWFKHNDCIVVSLPGVPFEMIGLMQEFVLPRLSQLNVTQVIIHKTLHTFGLPESFLAERLAEWERGLPKGISLAYLPSPVSIRLRLTSIGDNRGQVEESIDDQVERLKAVIPEYLFGYNENDTMASVVGDMLRKTNATLSVAESCTGGMVSQLITSMPGSSDYFNGSVVAYANRVKKEVLGVDKNLIEKYGAVSQEVVEAMALGVKRAMHSDYAIATSGVAGPGGGTLQKPVGTLWIAISSPTLTMSKLFKLGGDRERIILRGAVTALNMLRLRLVEENVKSF